jgi:hypothetical protein
MAQLHKRFSDEQLRILVRGNGRDCWPELSFRTC